MRRASVGDRPGRLPCPLGYPNTGGSMKQNQEISHPPNQPVATVTRRSMLSQTRTVGIALFGLRLLPVGNRSLVTSRMTCPLSFVTNILPRPPLTTLSGGPMRFLTFLPPRPPLRTTFPRRLGPFGATKLRGYWQNPDFIPFRWQLFEWLEIYPPQV